MVEPELPFLYKQCYGITALSTSLRSALAQMLQPQVLVNPLELWEALAALVLQTPPPRASLIALSFLTSRCSLSPHKQLLKTWHCPSVLKVVTQILTWAFPGVPALFGPNQQDFSQPPPQSAAGTPLPPYPGGGTCLSHGCTCCFADQPADHTSCQDWVFFSQFHLQMLRAINFSLQALATESLTSQPAETAAWPETNCSADKALYCNALPRYLDLSAASHTGTEQNSPLRTNNGPLAGPSAVSLPWDSWHLPV